MHALGHGKCLFAALDRARPGDNRTVQAHQWSPPSRKTDDRVVFLKVAASPAYTGLETLITSCTPAISSSVPLLHFAFNSR